MNIVHITAGAGGMYCGICLRDNALVAALRRLGHEVLMVPLYLPLTLDEEDQSAGTPIFFGGINVYLEQKSSLFSALPGWMHDLLRSRKLLKWAGSKAGNTRPQDLGDITVSMLRGEEGNQARELKELIDWLKQRPKPEIICLSNALLIGMARNLGSELNCPVVCMLQGEDGFLNLLPEPHRSQAWDTMAQRAKDVVFFGAPSRSFGEMMRAPLRLPPEKIRVIHNGINLDGFPQRERSSSPAPPVLGYFARMCPEKGLDILLETYVLLREGSVIKDLKLRIGGGCGPADTTFVATQKKRLEKAGLLSQVEFHPNLTRSQKVKFLQSLSAFCVPSRAAEAFGLYVIEAMAAGVPVVEPPMGSFPELIQATGGGLLAESAEPRHLAEKIEELLLSPDASRKLGEAGRLVVSKDFSSEAMVKNTLAFYQEAIELRPAAAKT
jgi:glycosyltransferase involved in cell wall biosynthesis